jgi:hypothetical protein
MELGTTWGRRRPSRGTTGGQRVHIVCIQNRSKKIWETPCAAGETRTRTTPTPSTTGGPPGGDSGGDGGGRPHPTPVPYQKARPRRERSAGRGSSSSERQSRGRHRETGAELGSVGRARRQPMSTTSRRLPRETPPVHVSGRPRACDGTRRARGARERRPRRSGQPGQRTGGRAAGPLDLIHRGAPHLFLGCMTPARDAASDTARRGRRHHEALVTPRPLDEAPGRFAAGASPTLPG